MNKKVWQSMGACLLAGFLTVQAQAEGKPGVNSKSKAEADVKSAVQAIDSGQFEIVSVEKAAKEGWFNVVMLLPNGKEVSVSVNGNSRLVAGYVEETEEPVETEEPAPTEDPVQDEEPASSDSGGLVDDLNPFGL